MRVLDQPRQVSKHELAFVNTHDAELRMQRGERIVGDLRLRGADRGEKSRLAGVRQTDDAGIRDQLQAKPDGALFAGQSGIGVARRLVSGCLEVRIAEAAIAALGDHDRLPDVGQIGEQRLAVLLIDLRAGRDLHGHVLAVRAGAVLAHAGAAVLRCEVLLVAIIDQRVQPVHGCDDHITAAPAVTAVRPAEFDELLAAERHAAVPPVSGADVDLGFIKKFHAMQVMRFGMRGNRLRA